MERIRFTYVTWDEVLRLCYTLAEKVLASRWRPDTIVAVGRGGYVPARLLSDYLQVRDLLSLQAEFWTTAEHRREVVLKHLPSTDLRGRRVLVVDDIADTGETLKRVSEYLRRSYQVRELRTAVLHYKAVTCRTVPDYYAVELRECTWIVYPWELTETIRDLCERFHVPREEASVLQLLKKLGLEVPEDEVRRCLRLIS